MIGIALWNLGVGLWNGFFFLFIVNDGIITHSMLPAHQRIFFVLRPVTLPQLGLGRIGEQVQVLVA